MLCSLNLGKVSLMVIEMASSGYHTQLLSIYRC